MSYEEYKDGFPCHHIGCLRHTTHPCEGCGRVSASRARTTEWWAAWGKEVKAAKDRIVDAAAIIGEHLSGDIDCWFCVPLPVADCTNPDCPRAQLLTALAELKALQEKIP